MRTPHFAIVILLLAVAGAAAYVLFARDRGATDDAPPVSAVASFGECVEAGHPVMESYPRQCRTPDGRTFTEDVGNELEKSDLIRIEAPRPNAEVSSPLTVSGMARGYWYFEASFPVRLFDADGNELAVAPAQAQDEWMTEEFVPFEVTLVFDPPATPTGVLRLERDNPSGLPENDDALIVPVVF